MAGAEMRSATANRRTASVVAESNDKKAERKAVKEQIQALQTIIDSITSSTTLGELRGCVKDVTRVLRRVARILT